VKQGRTIFGVELEIFGQEGQILPHDGVAFGDLKARGPWVAAGYYHSEGGEVLDADGWFPTGDVATLDADGFVQITDRSKDVIKSGGEWISSIDLENIAMGHPAVQEAAVIGVACGAARTQGLSPWFLQYRPSGWVVSGWQFGWRVSRMGWGHHRILGGLCAIGTLVVGDLGLAAPKS
jgi:acyl-CoA synthetase (AMP-forming)/AMP-acid ligase II